ncbi:Twitching mobility protein [subsurface metagenome]
MDLDFLLKEMAARGASDLHLIAGISPIIRIDGDLKVLEKRPLTSEEVKSLIYSGRVSS